MGLTLVSPPAELPVSLGTAKAQVNVAGSTRDALLNIYLTAATDRVERFLGRSLIDQTWDVVLDGFPADGGAIELPNPPLIEVLGVYYETDAGSETEVSAADYILDASRQPARLTPVSGAWATPRAGAASVRIRYRAGYLDSGVSPPAANVPASIQAAILLLVGDLYAHRETMVVGDTASEMPKYLEAFLRPYRVRLGMA